MQRITGATAHRAVDGHLLIRYIYMVDTPKETRGGEATEENPSGRKAKHVHYQRHSKPRHINTGPGGGISPECAEEEYSPDQPTFKQAGLAMVGYLERGNYTPPPRMR